MPSWELPAKSLSCLLVAVGAAVVAVGAAATTPVAVKGIVEVYKV
jgi:hypothetical protein